MQPASERHPSMMPVASSADPTASSGVRIRYMGNKEALAIDVASVYRTRGNGRTLVDLFGGMCNVAGSIARTGGQAWVNDVQAYAVLAAQCLVASPIAPPNVDAVRCTLSGHYGRNLRALHARFDGELSLERTALRDTSFARLRAYDQAWRHAGNDAKLAAEIADLAARPSFPHRLVTVSFACGYFGIRQAIELDSLRHAIDVAQRDSAISRDAARWLRLAWLQTASRIAATPGHFAQYLRLTTDAGAARVVAARRRSAWDLFWQDLAWINPYGTTRWRRKNRVLSSDASMIWPQLDARGLGPAVFYADPPYSKEHYSRFYHVLETMERYDYPALSGAGRYRPDRFASDFAIKSKVLPRTRSLLENIAARGDAVLLSYPTTGLLTDKLGIDLPALLGEFFTDVHQVVARPSRHSSLGARHGASATDVVEYVWWAQ